MRYIQATVPRRGRLVRDWQHAGAYVLNHPHLSSKLIREITPRQLMMRSVPSVIGAAALGAGAGYALHRLANPKMVKKGAA
jgi:hypothetical protein